MKKYLVEVNNEILGNSEHIMTEEQIKNFNTCAYKLCQSVKVAGGIHNSGMWTVREVEDVEEIIIDKGNIYLIVQELCNILQEAVDEEEAFNRGERVYAKWFEKAKIVLAKARGEEI